MRGKAAKALRRQAYDERARVRLYRAINGQAFTADPSRVALTALKRARADRSSCTPTGAAVIAAEQRKARRARRRAKEAAHRRIMASQGEPVAAWAGA